MAKAVSDLNDPNFRQIRYNADAYTVSKNPYFLWTQPGNRIATMEGVRDGRLHVDHLISHRIKPDEAPAVYERLLQKDRAFVGVLIDWA